MGGGGGGRDSVAGAVSLDECHPPSRRRHPRMGRLASRGRRRPVAKDSRLGPPDVSLRAAVVCVCVCVCVFSVRPLARPDVVGVDVARGQRVHWPDEGPVSAAAALWHGQLWTGMLAGFHGQECRLG